MKYPILGHRKILDFFDKVQKNNALSHAYCFVGRDHIGKRAVAEHIAAGILSQKEEKSKVNPDIFCISRGADEKTGKKKKDISIEQIKDARLFLSTRPIFGKHKVLIVEEAEKMSAGASNAILKTLEEPAEYALLLLLTENEESLLETIGSRCQTIFFQSVTSGEIETFLSSRGVDEARAKEMATRSCGLPGKAIRWLENPEEFDAHRAEVERFASLGKKPMHEKIAIVEHLFGEKKDHIRARESWEDILSIWQLCIRDYIISGMKSAPESGKEFLHNINLYNQITESKKLLLKNVHPRLVVENILLNIF